ncbi:serine hydrolase FSH [Hyaloscypha finlandica]|nr:serine hydrolase FSH [Hyaloscypha finlandica]
MTRVLCLHGYGSNTKIFEAQTAAFRRELGPEFEWHFVEGGISVPMDPELQEYCMGEENFFSFFDATSNHGPAKYFTEIESYATSHGPFDLVMAMCFSGSLVAALLMHKAHLGRHHQVFKGAIFLSGGGVMDPTASTFKPLEDASAYAKIPIPTANIWGASDEIHRKTAAELALVCCTKINVTFIHDADTPIAQSRDKKALAGTVKAIRRTVDEVLFS